MRSHTAIGTASDAGIDTNSPLWNPDLAPTALPQRTWSTYDFAALWIGLSVVITTYTLASGLMQQGMPWWQALLTILLGNVIVLVPMLLNAHAGARYGISFPVLCRASFGVLGANVPALLRAVVACGWFGIQTWIGGLALDTLLQAAWPAWGGIAGSTWLAFGLFWIVQVGVIVRGTEGIRRLERVAAPLLLAGGGVLLIWAIARGGGLGHVLGESARLQGADGASWRLFPAGLTAAVGYWATLSLNIPDFTRYARSQRAPMLGQALGLPLTMTAFSFIGVVVTSAALVVVGEAVWDPVELIRRIGSPGVIVGGALMVLVAQISTNLAANVVAPANDFSNVSPRRISYVTGGLLTAVIGILIMPCRLYSDAAAYIFTWLIGYSSLMGAIGGILIADYWIVRRRRLVVPDLFRMDGIYAYRGGVNLRALAALAAAILPLVARLPARGRHPGWAGGESRLLRSPLYVCVVRHLLAQLPDLPGADVPAGREAAMNDRDPLTTFRERLGAPRVLVGMLHVGALPGTPAACHSIQHLVEQAVTEARIFREAGFTAVVIENMHDRPYLKGTRVQAIARAFGELRPLP